ncbi:MULTISPECIES: hypothetical protein [unclassified Arcicella]|uniref:hypothetical protein n=1 Tax=unclassified Arcicella TaxID=2644986 RepID=UPI00285422D4|nr:MULTISPECIES: hypothetical protein [unclassified Arcicella]MDR6563504.1 hypothetical protein [Arcicella sp. BE51]MDR6813384.1 hypothetical protein [Arcicella sp. BE140]MDR6824697.1 hypothetical protein [Arcicella sp. BE139]
MKNSFKIILLTFNLLLVNNIYGQVSKTDSIAEVIIDPIEVFPFNIKRKSVYVNLPDKLKGTGLGVIKLHVNNIGKILRIDIQKLKIQLNNGKNISFSNVDSSSNYPPQIQAYYYYLKKYVGQVKIAPATTIKPPNKSFVYLLVRFKK